MPTVIRRTETVAVTDKRREVSRTVGWQVTTGAWSPPTDVFETESDYLVRVEVAGVRETDLEISFQDGILVIAGTRSDVPAGRRAYHQMEIHFGKFSAAVGVPGPIDLDKAVAEYRDGFLLVRMPKAKSIVVKIEG
ncbi:MAG TPA: Hsp20/alpha crystallin family protein [Anaerolineales bacterium]